MNDSELCAEFLANGIVKIPVSDIYTLNNIRNVVCGNPDPNDFHKTSSSENLNKFRVEAIARLNGMPDIRDEYFYLARHAIETLVGNELAMQRQINLSIQLPGDDSSLLPIHQDVLQGDSPYEVVLWVPLVNCYDTKSMFFSRKKIGLIKQVNKPWSIEEQPMTPEDIYALCDPYFVDVKYGECLIFSQSHWHGNVVNETSETRWSMNCRFKSLLSPYGDKKIGEFFEPLNIKPATRLGHAYVTPEI